MTAKSDDAVLESLLAESLMEPRPQAVSDDEFIALVNDALEAAGGRLLFRMRTITDDQDQHVAAACVGDGEERQFLLLSVPASGGTLSVEPTSGSANPVAGIAAAYAGLVDAFKVAA